MSVNFTNLYKLIPEKKKILRKINTLIRNSKFIGGKEVKIFENNFSSFVKDLVKILSKHSMIKTNQNVFNIA